MTTMQVKERSILFSGEMVRAILEGRKTQTRRVARPGPPGDLSMYPALGAWRYEGVDYRANQVETCPYGKSGDREWQAGRIPAPGFYYVRRLAEDRPVYLQWIDPEPQDVMTGDAVGGYLWGWNESDDPEAVEMEGVRSESLEWKRPGDRLYVREEHYRFGHWEPVPGVKTKTGRMKWRFVADTEEVRYDPPAEFRGGRHHHDPDTPAWHKRLGRFMPRSAARTVLEIINVRVERVQDISEEDAWAEGCPPDRIPDGCPSALAWFHALWEPMNAKRGYGWDANPWVWVVEFRRVTT